MFEIIRTEGYTGSYLNMESMEETNLECRDRKYFF